MKIGFCPCLFKLCYLGRVPSCKKRIGNLIFFNHVQMFFYHGIKGFNAHKPCTKIIHFSGAILQHIVCQLFWKTSHCKKRQRSLLKNLIGKLGIVRYIGHGSLDQWKFCSLVFGKRGTRLYWIKCIYKI